MRSRLAQLLVALPLGAAGCYLTSSLDELQGDPEGCDATHADCDGIAANGCETDVESTAQHCGACNQACPSAPSSAPTCTGGQCGIACDLFAASCDGNDANGCETAVEKDADNCGGCGHVCGDTNTTSSACDNGACAIVCGEGFANCDGDDGTACETKLGSPQDCGICGRSCLTGDCTAGECPVSDHLDFATALAVSNGHVYVTTSQSDCDANNNCTHYRWLRRVSVGGGAIEDLYELPSAVSDIAVDASGNLYLLRSTALEKYSPSATNPGPTTLHSGGLGGLDPGAVEVDATHAYLIRQSFLQPQGILRIPLEGGEPKVVVDLENGNWLGSNTSQLAIGGDVLYFSAEWFAEGLHSVPISGGSPTLLHPGKVRALAAHGSAAYFTLESDTTVLYKATGGEVVDLVVNEKRPESIVSDGTRVWWWNRDAGVLRSASVNGTEVTSAFAYPTATAALVALGPGSVFWLIPSTGQLNGLPQ